MAVGELFLSAFLQVLFDRLAPHNLSSFPCENEIRSELKKWNNKLLMIQAVLSDAEEKQLTNKAVKTWLDHLQDLAYDVEDILDEYATQVLEHQLITEQPTSNLADYFSSWSPSALMSKLDIKSKIEEITGCLEDLCERRDYLGLEKVNAGEKSWQRPPSTCLPTEPAVIGRDEDKAKILEMMLKSDETSGANFLCIPLVGMGGIGKTTLARELYNDKAMNDFNPKAWVCVSDDFDVLRISKAILESITSMSCTLTNLNAVLVQLKNALSGKKFLLVLDDVWSKDYSLWETLKSSFVDGAAGSKIIVTTRSLDVALTMEQMQYYNLKLLTEDACWAIFEKHVSGNKVITAGRNLKLIRRKVVEKCKGLPLAAKTLGGLLRCKQRYDEWEDILDSKIWDLPEENGILSVLRLSYHHLPSHLKRCFAYCAIFPKGYGFIEKELILLWMAEGLIEQPENKQLEDLGSEYFRDLCSRSIFQHSNHDPSKFVMHDLVNDLAQWISGDTSFMLQDVSGLALQSKRLGRVRYSSYIRRRYEVKNKFEVFHRVEHLRTFFSFQVSDYKTYITDTTFSDLFSRLKKLRVISLENYCITELPNSIENLRHLRYLNLSCTSIRSLPESISSLFNLQILILRKCSRLTKLPFNVGNLINLHHLDIYGACLIREMPLGMRKLKYLSTLSNFIVGRGVGSSLNDLKDLKFLRGELIISSLENVADCHDTKENILSDKKNLEVLVLEWSCDFNPSRDGVVEEIVLGILQPQNNLKELTINNFGGQKFPSWVGDPSFFNMVVLKLDGCQNCSTLPSLGLLGSLKNLTIRKITMLKKIGAEIYGEICSQSFQSLETLCFENLPEWEHWNPSEENECGQRFPCLRELSISQCPKLSGTLPTHLPLLETLVINKCEQLVVSFSSLPMLRSLEINRCKGMVYSSPTDSKTLNSLTQGESNSAVFRSWTTGGFQSLEILKVVGCEELMHLWPNEICLDKPLHGLLSFSTLKELYMRELPDLVSFPDGFLSILRKVTLWKCSALTSLQEGLKHNNARLEHLMVHDCHSLKFIVRGQLPSSLKLLCIRYCENIVSVVDDSEDTCTTFLHTLEVQHCPSLTHLWSGQLPSTLTKLKIRHCSNLRTLSSTGQFDEALEFLQIDSCAKLESLAQSLDNNMSLEYFWISECENLKSIPEGLHTLSNLRSIFIYGCSSLVTFPKDGLPHNCLKVFIHHCEKLTALPSRMRNLKSLQHLSLWQCPSIVSFPEEDFPTNLTSLVVDAPNIYKPLTEWGLHKLTCLRELTIGASSDAVSFPEEEIEVKLPTSLIELTIRRFPKLKFVSSKVFQNLTSLESLTIRECPNFTSLPDLPSSLLELYINVCPLLKERCKRDEGQDWFKIAHIPFIEIDRKFIHDL